MKINWKVRIKNKAFWLGFIPALLLLVQAVAGVFGMRLDLNDIGGKLMEVVQALFVVLAMLGIVVDPTTNGVNDSSRAMSYDAPKEDWHED